MFEAVFMAGLPEITEKDERRVHSLQAAFAILT